MTSNLHRVHRVIVHTLWQGDVDVAVPGSRLRVIDPDPVYMYRQHGRTIVSREPMIPVEFWWNEGREEGVITQRDLVGLVVPYLDRGLTPPILRPPPRQ